MNEVVKRAKIKPEQVNLVVMGENYQSGEYVNIARMGLLTAGWPVEVPGITLDRRCPSGADAINIGTMTILSGNADIVVAGGVESMSTAEMYMTGDMRWGIGGSGDAPRGHGSLASWSVPMYDRIQRARTMSQPSSRFGVLPSMMTWAENAAVEFKVTREDCDKWAVQSNHRAFAAMNNGKFDQEIIPVPVPGPKGTTTLFSKDERPRGDTTVEAISKLKPVLGGVCTAANSCGENDGASVVVLMSEAKMKELGIKPMAYVKSFGMGGADPRYAYKAATAAVKIALAKANLTVKDIDLFELHEAFAAQTISNMREMGITDESRVNVNGSCVSLGHPLGATGARIVTTLAYELNRRNVNRGLVAICGGGGMGVAIILERV